MDEKGITLVELLAVLAIGAFLILIVSNILSGVYKQYRVQEGEAGEIFDITYAAKVITRDFRMAEEIVVDERNKDIDLKFTKPDSTEVIYSYNSDEEIIYRNSTEFIRGINKFIVTDNKNNSFEIELKSKDGKVIKTQLVQRK